MKVRYPEIDYSNIKAHWTPDPEFSQMQNAGSTVPAHIEPYLVKVMILAKKKLDPKFETLHANVDIFIKQEIQHCKQHLAFNNRLYELGYEGMQELEEPYKQDYVEFLATKSLRFNVAYCEGFEAMGTIAAQAFFEDMDEQLRGADENVLNMWKWHLAEEFEHRAVCSDVYRALYGSGPYAYVYRVWAFLYALKHIGSHVMGVAKYLIAKDREGITEKELKEADDRKKAPRGKMGKSGIFNFLHVFSPFYDPSKKKPSPGMAEILATFPDHR